MVIVMLQMHMDVAVTPRVLFNANPIVHSRYRKEKGVLIQRKRILHV